MSPPPTAPPLDCTLAGSDSNPECYLIVVSDGTWVFDCGGSCSVVEGDTLYNNIGITANGESINNPGPIPFACPISSLVNVTSPTTSEVTNGTVDYGPVPIPSIPQSANGGAYNYDGPQLQIEACPGWIAQIVPTPGPTDTGVQPPNNGT